MTSAPQSPGRQAAAAARALADALPGSAQLGCAAAQLAIACLDVAEAPSDWLEAHDLVRDAGVRRVRETLAGETARAFALAGECVRMMAIHGGLPASVDGLPQRLTDLAKAVGVALGAMARVEIELADRIAEPRLAELSLEDRRKRMSVDPTALITRIRQLAGNVENLKRQDDDLRGHEESLSGKHEALQKELAARQRRLDELDLGIAALKGQIAERGEAARVAERERLALADRLRTADADLARVHRELEELRNDPRQAVRARVQAALLALDSRGAEAQRPTGGSS
jgi:hypothetical protein